MVSVIASQFWGLYPAARGIRLKVVRLWTVDISRPIIDPLLKRRIFVVVVVVCLSGSDGRKRLAASEVVKIGIG